MNEEYRREKEEVASREREENRTDAEAEKARLPLDPNRAARRRKIRLSDNKVKKPHKNRRKRRRISY